MSDDVVISGVGIHPFGRFADVSPSQMGQTAVVNALRDANMQWRDVEAAFFSSMYLPATSGPRVLKPLGATGIPICDVEAACASGGVALRQAVLGIRAGAFSSAVVLGVEKMPRGFMDPSMIFDSWQVEMAMTVNPSYWAMRARRHMYDYGTTDLQIAKVALKNHRHSEHNENAMYRKVFTLEQIMASPVVCDPIRLLEICAPNEGAAAVIVRRANSKDVDHSRSVHILSSVHVLAGYSADWRAPMTSLSATIPDVISPTASAAHIAYDEANIGPDGVDCFEVQDTDAFCELEAYEQLGLCAVGEGGQLIDQGVTQLGGRSPVNVSGGLISKGEPVGASHLAQVAELVTQLRSEAGVRQVTGAKVGLAHVLGAAGNCAITIVAR